MVDGLGTMEWALRSVLGRRSLIYSLGWLLRLSRRVSVAMLCMQSGWRVELAVEIVLICCLRTAGCYWCHARSSSCSCSCSCSRRTGSDTMVAGDEALMCGVFVGAGHGRLARAAGSPAPGGRCTSRCGALREGCPPEVCGVPGSRWSWWRRPSEGHRPQYIDGQATSGECHCARGVKGGL